MSSLRVAIVVHGRFHAFGLAAALAELGHEVTLFTNYPRFFSDGDLPASVRVETFWMHFLRSRLWRFPAIANKVDSEESYLSAFGQWAESKLRDQQWDVVYSWSSVSKEILESQSVKARCKVVARGSTHILFQDRILEEESQRTGYSIERPCSAAVQRELFEYQHADAVVVLSQFCKRTFLNEGMDPKRLILMVPGCNLKRFSASQETRKARRLRALCRKPLRLVTLGTFSQRKGALDYCEIVESLGQDKFEFRFVGSISKDAEKLAKRLGPKVQWVKRVKQSEVPSQLAWGDVFLFPTLEEGMPQSAMQANAAGLPIITTENGAAKDLLSVGAKCWEMPVRNPKEVAELLSEIERHRSKLLLSDSEETKSRTWTEAATELLAELNERFKLFDRDPHNVSPCATGPASETK